MITTGTRALAVIMQLVNALTSNNAVIMQFVNARGAFTNCMITVGRGDERVRTPPGTGPSARPAPPLPA